MSAYTAAELAHFGFDVPADYTRHDWRIGREARACQQCGEREAGWDDFAYPFDPCPATEYRDADGESVEDFDKIAAWFDAADAEAGD